uniref:RNA methyltransferase n=1 Tax=Hanusia phi TaxID=3032 RepID=A0A7S0HSN5_9CRYP|mmetsp:Transcript_34204/g.77007  ORF Transcript_34204/g.77007 Transcript_34204/m.77007 type:complete len:410 (+) Transcript_34204:37-1266(+)
MARVSTLHPPAAWKLAVLFLCHIHSCEIALIGTDGVVGGRAVTAARSLRLLQRLRGGFDEDELDKLIQEAYSVDSMHMVSHPAKRGFGSYSTRDSSAYKRPRFTGNASKSSSTIRHRAQEGRARSFTLYSNLDAKYQVQTSSRLNSTALKASKPAFNNRPDNFTAVKGNFNSYYGYRRANAVNSSIGKVLRPGVWSDPRLDVLQSHFFQGKTCLDIGCNSGYLTMSIAYMFQCKSMIGIDCDASLIQHAKKVKKNIKWDFEKEGRNKCPVYFHHEDFIASDHFKEAKYDVITCFSVTKWVHLVYGDEGIKKMFSKCHDLLQDDGILILEPQPWRSYHNKRKVSAEIEEMYKNISIRPSQFVNETLPAAGFVVEDLGAPDGMSVGFTRHIYLCRKNKTVAERPDGMTGKS